ncbi:[protein-PII] uridylyltransferase [Amaricoccus macauensis]|uniref:[protein-PII] uridylyltransferase n=1 Tax=Amaricoccus macauensis TaxID=57001 RepID=UPI003C7BDD89
MRIEQSLLPTTDTAWSGLVDEPKHLIDREGLLAEFAVLQESASDPTDFRNRAVKAIADAYTSGRELIADLIAQSPREAYRAVYDYTRLTDQMIRLILELSATYLHPRPNPTEGERIAVVAVGGYGRGEMAPFSDVDILFLTPYKQTAWCETLIESALYCLWDLKLKVGQAVRTVDDCIRQSKKDGTIRTSLLEQRHLWGNEALSTELRERLFNELFKGTGPEFVELKLEERAERHKRQGSSRYLLEPNIKDGKGGLRDLQMLFWIAKYLNNVRSPEDLVELGVFSPEEYEIFVEAAAFLWTARVHLHLINNRASELLSFDMQVEVSERLGYGSTDGQRAVECFMQDYFTHAKHVGDLTRIFSAALEAQHVKAKPGLTRAFRNVFSYERDTTGPLYRLKHGRIDVAEEEEFLSDPVNFLRLFKENLVTGIPIHPDVLRLVVANLDLIDDRMRENEEANHIFLELLLNHNNPERVLRLMNEVGVLGAFMPEFGRIVAMMQFNMYHHYTVDEHTIRVISTLSKIERGEMKQRMPTSTRILSRGINRRVLYVALLLHDIGKGSGQDHSIYGADVALKVCPRLGLNAEETELVSWLVRHHLLMSDVAQKRDLTDPRTVRDFAQVVKSPTRLRLLTVLTVCDIHGVGPNVWNNWKASLLRALYGETLEYLTGGSQAQGRPEREAEAKEALSAALEGWSAEEIELELSRHYAPYWLGFDNSTHVIFAELLRKLPTDEAAIAIEQDDARDATRACFAMTDHPGIFARLTGALALVGANVVDARSYITSDGVATAAFWIQDADGQPYGESRLGRLRRSVQRTLKGEILASEALKEKDRIKPRERKFSVPTRVSFDNTGSDIYTIVEVETFDRPGLLFDLSRAFKRGNISVASSIVATYGKQAVDVFYVKDIFGLKIHSQSKQRALEARIRTAIDPGSAEMPPQARAVKQAKGGGGESS